MKTTNLLTGIALAASILAGSGTVFADEPDRSAFTEEQRSQLYTVNRPDLLDQSMQRSEADDDMPLVAASDQTGDGMPESYGHTREERR